MPSIPTTWVSAIYEPILAASINVSADGYSNDNAGGLGLTTSDAVTYIKKLSNEAAKYGMSTGLKNAQEILPQANQYVEFAVNEECAMNSGDCASYSGFGKPVYHIEYTNGRSVSSSELSKFCNTDIPEFTTVIKTLNLDGWVTYCDGSSATSPTSEAPPQKGGKDCGGRSDSHSPESLGLAL
jgi:hypothetical protein